MEIQADQYGILYTALAGYDIESIVSSDNNVILKFTKACKLCAKEHNPEKAP